MIIYLFKNCGFRLGLGHGFSGGLKNLILTQNCNLFFSPLIFLWSNNL